VVKLLYRNSFEIPNHKDHMISLINLCLVLNDKAKLQHLMLLYIFDRKAHSTYLTIPYPGLLVDIATAPNFTIPGYEAYCLSPLSYCLIIDKVTVINFPIPNR
jgi:hypothetical protein